MARPPLATRSEIDALLPSDWAYDGAWLRRSFRFDSFSEAFGFMARSALAAERLDHHPNWSNVWATVEVSLQTHDAGGVTRLDLDLAAEMNRCAGEAGGGR